MVSRDTIAQLRQDITTADDLSDEVEGARLRRELETALARDQAEKEAGK